MITNIELTDVGIAKFNKWFADVAKEGVRIDAVMLEMLDRVQDSLSIGDTPIYELGQRSTNTGRPELLRLEPADMVISEEADE